MLALATLTSCVYVPVPENPISSPHAVHESFLQSEKTTRTDILLRFGDPDQTEQAERFFIYRWEHVTGILAFGYGPMASGKSFKGDVFLVIEFKSDGSLARHQRFESPREMFSWMNESPVAK